MRWSFRKSILKQNTTTYILSDLFKTWSAVSFEVEDPAAWLENPKAAADYPFQALRVTRKSRYVQSCHSQAKVTNIR
jgi:hypothetical protein